MTTVLKITLITIQSTVFVHHMLCKYILDKFKEIKNWLYDGSSHAVMIPAALFVEFYKKISSFAKVMKIYLKMKLLLHLVSIWASNLEVNHLDNNILLWTTYARNTCLIERKEGIAKDDKKSLCHKTWNKWNYYGIMYKKIQYLHICRISRMF